MNKDPFFFYIFSYTDMLNLKGEKRCIKIGPVLSWCFMKEGDFDFKVSLESG